MRLAEIDLLLVEAQGDEVDDTEGKRACTGLRAVFRKAPEGLTNQPTWRTHAVARPHMRPTIRTATSLV